MSDIRDTISNFTRNVTKTSGDLFKTTKLSMSVSTEQAALKNLYMEVGKKVHEIYQYGGNLGKFFDEKYAEMEACERKIEELKEEISQIKGVRECPKCGKTAERSSEFCPKCGLRFGAPVPHEHTPPPEHDYTPSPAIQLASPIQDEPPPVAETPPPQPATRRCRVCGMENDSATKFCLSCGRIVD